MDNAWDKFNEIESAKDSKTAKDSKSAKDSTKEVELVTLDTTPDKDIMWVFLYSLWPIPILQRKNGFMIFLFSSIYWIDEFRNHNFILKMCGPSIENEHLWVCNNVSTFPYIPVKYPKI